MPQKDVRWKNFGGQISYTPELTYFPGEAGRREDHLAELKEIVRTAERDHKGIRATKSTRRTDSGLDTGCSFTEVAVSDDHLVAVDHLDQLLEYVGESSHIPGFSGHWSADGLANIPFTADALHQRYGLAYVEAGMRISSLAHWLRPFGAALPTMGGVQTQTLAGAVSTGTHGSDLNKKPLADWIRAVHLIAPGGREIWIERSKPHNITSANGFRTPRWSSDLETIYDDDTFFAALVSLGRLGIIYGLVIETEKWFWLQEDTIEMPWTEVRSRLDSESFSEFIYGNSYFSNDFADHRPLSMHHHMLLLSLGNDNRCHMTRRWITNRLESRSKPDLPGGFEVWSDLHSRGDVLEAVQGLRSGDLTKFQTLSDADKRFLNNWFWSKLFRRYEARGTYWEMMKGEPPPLPGSSAEYCFDVNDNSFLQLADQILDLASSPQMVGWLSLRFTPRSDALLAMQRFEHTVHLEIGVAESPGTAAFFDRVDRVARSLGAIPHWGQLHQLSEHEVEKIYGADLRRFRKAIRRLSRHGRRSTFSNRFTRERGLEPVSQSDNLLLFG